MIVGVPREIKADEYRIALLPVAVNIRGGKITNAVAGDIFPDLPAG